MNKIKASDVVLQIRVEGDGLRELRLRWVTKPDAEQKLLLHRLGLTLPKRLGFQLAPPNCSEDSRRTLAQILTSMENPAIQLRNFG